MRSIEAFVDDIKFFGVSSVFTEMGGKHTHTQKCTKNQLKFWTHSQYFLFFWTNERMNATCLATINRWAHNVNEHWDFYLCQNCSNNWWIIVTANRMEFTMRFRERSVVFFFFVSFQIVHAHTHTQIIQMLWHHCQWNHFMHKWTDNDIWFVDDLRNNFERFYCASGIFCHGLFRRILNDENKRIKFKWFELHKIIQCEWEDDGEKEKRIMSSHHCWKCFRFSPAFCNI